MRAIYFEEIGSYYFYDRDPRESEISIEKFTFSTSSILFEES